MKRFEPQQGGHRFRLNDLILMQDAYSEIVRGIISAFHPSMTCIFSGAKVSISSNNVSMSEGFVALNGEMYMVNSIELPYQPMPKRLFLRVVEDVLTPSPVTYQDTSVQNVHLNRYMNLKYFDVADGDVSGINGVYYDEIAPGGVYQKGMILEWEPDYLGEENDVFDDTGLGIGRMSGWALCNGLNNTKDMRGQFTLMPSVGVKNSAPLLPNVFDGLAFGQHVGKKEINILQANLPNYNLQVNDPGHVHALPADVQYNGTAGGGESGTAEKAPPTNKNTATAQTNITVNSAGGNQPLTNIPPAVSIFKIKRII